MQSKDNLIWIDLEMTGLDVEQCRIIEIAAIITDKDLNIIAESEAIAIHHSDEVIESMNEWCVKTHAENGLTQRVKDSMVSTIEAEKIILKLIKKYVPIHSSPLCGNSIWQDRRFLAKYMPKIDEYCHYRVLDVSSFKIANSLWSESKKTYFKQNSTHLALDDIRESINEMMFYKEKFLG